MKELTIEEKAKAYDEAFEKAKNWYIDSQIGFKKSLETLFPQLKELEDEKIRKDIVAAVETYGDFTQGRKEEIYVWIKKQGESDETKAKIFLISKGYPIDINGKFPTYEEMYNIIKEGIEKQNDKKLEEQLDKMIEADLSWFEKQDEQKTADKVESKFHEGDWIVFNGLTLYVKEVVKGFYRTISKGYGIANSYDWNIDNVARLWTLEDAKDGDVLAYVTDEEDLWIMIYWSLYEPYKGHVHYHALLVNDNFSDKGTCCICIDNLKPATKEQHDLLFAKMKEAGYVWDAEKKELKKIERNNTDEYTETKGLSKLEAEELTKEISNEKHNLTEFEDAVKDMMDTYRDAIGDNDATTEEVKEHAAYLLSLISCKSTEWSEEDTETLNGITNYLFTSTDVSSIEGSDKWYDWLKNLRPQNQNRWKPSDEQIKALEHFVRSVGESGYASPYDNNTKLLYSLLE